MSEPGKSRQISQGGGKAEETAPEKVRSGKIVLCCFRHARGKVSWEDGRGRCQVFLQVSTSGPVLRSQLGHPSAPTSQALANGQSSGSSDSRLLEARVAASLPGDTLVPLELGKGAGLALRGGRGAESGSPCAMWL